MKHILIIWLILLLSACANGNGINLLPYQNAQNRPEYFSICHGFSCTHRTYVLLEEKQWHDVLKPFRRKAKNAESERKKIAEAISRMEKHVVKATEMNLDVGGAETFAGDQHQMDCLDETINTSMYLSFFDKAGVLKFHDVGDPVHRGYFVDGLWPHNSASVRERETGDIYAIDSYYEDNGQEVHVVALDIWLDEWRPTDQPQ